MTSGVVGCEEDGASTTIPGGMVSRESERFTLLLLTSCCFFAGISSFFFAPPTSLTVVRALLPGLCCCCCGLITFCAIFSKFILVFSSAIVNSTLKGAWYPNDPGGCFSFKLS